MTRYVALLRAIANVPMAPFRRRFERLGFEDVSTYGMSGNVIFTANHTSPRALERRITSTINAETFIRSGVQLAGIARRDPFAKKRGATVMFLDRTPNTARMRALRRTARPGSDLRVRGKDLYLVFPLRKAGRSSPIDVERALGVKGTFRSSNVVRALAQRGRASP